MVIAAVEIKLYLPWVHSLKEKRMAVKSILQKTQHHFHVSAAEVDYQDVQQSAAIAFAVVTCTVKCCRISWIMSKRIHRRKSQI